jgi:hypothetical protein
VSGGETLSQPFDCYQFSGDGKDRAIIIVVAFFEKPAKLAQAHTRDSLGPRSIVSHFE